MGRSYTYSLVSGTGSTDNAQFVIDGDVLKLSDTFNAGGKTSLKVRVRTTDTQFEGRLYFEKELTISLVTAPTDIVSNTSRVPNINSSVCDTYRNRASRSNVRYSLVSGTGFRQPILLHRWLAGNRE